MSDLVIRDLAECRVLERPALAAVRGGAAAVVNTSVVNNLNLGLGVSNALVMPISVLNGSFVGAPVKFDLDLAPRLLADIGV